MLLYFKGHLNDNTYSNISLFISPIPRFRTTIISNFTLQRHNFLLHGEPVKAFSVPNKLKEKVNQRQYFTNIKNVL